ncbi:hypothetical protein TSAR_002996 [Trichomalopsis sarcophagae]|uniref:Serine/arginine repetitive matrix protein 1-like n=1 Tax=Trichomalopsis sarcophagae TaxID=543379 RepID=A0A232ETT7_9HYME|nr:hypothetical protein TSAR_002996 [Trichomalopsis sarcophagae]
MSRDDRRRGGSNSSTKLRMDSSSSQSKSHGDSSSKRKELDNVMRKARESQSSYWNKKLLEAEEKDPNRWRHSGYKEMYIGGISTNNSKFHQRSPKHRSPHPRSPRPRSPRSPRIRSPVRPRSRTPRNRNSRSPRRRSPRITNSFILKPRSPIIRRSNTPKTRSPKVRRSHTPKPRSPKTQRNQANNAQSRITKSPSSGSTCSDHSCSVCSPKDQRHIVNRRLSQSRSSSPARQHLPTKEVASLISRVGTSKTSRPRSPPIPRPQTPPPMPQPPSHHPKEYNKLTKDLKARKKESHRNKLADNPRVPESVQMMHKHVKLEKTHNMHPDVSMIHPPAESSGTDDSDSSSVASHAPPPKMTLSER